MPQLSNHFLTKMALSASAIIFLLSQQVCAIATPPAGRLKGAKALGQSSRSPQFYIERGRKYSRLFDFQKAVESYSVAIRMSPGFSEAYALRAETYSYLGQYQKQLDDLTSAIKLRPMLGDLYAKRADAYYQAIQFQKAIVDCQAAIRLNPDSAGGYRIAALVYDELGLYQKAIDIRTKLIGLKTCSALDLDKRAHDYELLDKLVLAQSDRQKANQLASPSDRVTMQLDSPLIDFNESTVEFAKNIVDGQLKDKPVILPFHYDPGGKICVAAQVNGRPLELMIDTGCEYSDLWKKAMPAISKLDSIPSQGIKLHERDFFRAKELKLGNLTISNVAMAVDRGLRDHRTLSGFLGGNILKNFALTIDYSKKQLILCSSVERHRTNNEIVVPMWVHNQCPYCTVTLDGKLSVQALIYTGTTGNLAADSLLKPLSLGPWTWRGLITGPSILMAMSDFFRLKSLELGSLKFESPYFEVYAAKGAPQWAPFVIIGNSALSTFKTVTFDYPSKQIIFEPNAFASESALGLIAEGHFLAAHDQTQQALDAFNQSMNLDNDFAESGHFYRAEIFRQSKKYQEAVSELDAAIKLDPKNLRTIVDRAIIHNNLREYAHEIDDYSQAIRLAPTSWSSYFNRASAYDLLGKHQLADRDRLKARKLVRLHAEDPLLY